MNVIIDINHPAHVHFFKNIYKILKNKGHIVIITVSKKEINIELLKLYNIEYKDIGSYGHSLFSKIMSFFLLEIRLLFIAIKFKPDIFLGIGSIRASHIAFLMNKKSYVFEDTEHSTEQIALYKPFATKIFTPDCFLDDLGPKQIRYPGYHELAYLHPNQFTPNPEVLKEIGLTEDSKFFVVRFVSWEASHDIGQKGLSLEDKRKLIETLKPHGKIIISSERELPSEFEEYRMTISPTKMHDLLYYATLYVGEGGTMASEAACLGTYSILINPLIAGTFEELKNKYHLLIQETNIDMLIKNINEFLTNPNKSEEYKINHTNFLNEKIDVTQYMIDLIEKEAITNTLKPLK